MKDIISRHAVKPIALAALWIGFSEFVRNQLLFAQLWIEHYRSLALSFPSSPINGMVWMLWSTVFAGLLYVLRSKFTEKETIIIGWIFGFVLMWLVIGNLGVLPYGLLIFAVPLSMLEAYGAVWIIDRVQT